MTISKFYGLEYQMNQTFGDLMQGQATGAYPCLMNHKIREYAGEKIKSFLNILPLTVHSC